MGIPMNADAFRATPAGREIADAARRAYLERSTAMGSVHDHLRDVHLYDGQDFAAAAQVGSEIEAHADDHEAYRTLRGDVRGSRSGEEWAAKVRRIEDNHTARGGSAGAHQEETSHGDR